MPKFPGFDDYNPNNTNTNTNINREESSGNLDEVLFDKKLEFENSGKYKEYKFNEEISRKIYDINVLLEEVRRLYGERLKNRIEIDSKKRWAEEQDIHELLDPGNLPKVRVDVKHEHLKNHRTKKFISNYEHMKKLNEENLSLLG